MASKKKKPAKAKTKAKKASNWSAAKAEELRQLFVHGTEDGEGNRVYPTLKALALDNGVSERTLYKRSSDEAWTEQKEISRQKLQVTIDEGKRKDIAKQSIDFDSRNLQLAKVIQNQVAIFVNNAEAIRRRMAIPHDVLDKNFQPRRQRNEEGEWEPIHHPGDPNYQAVGPTQLVMLSNSLSASQKVGRLALGEHTEKYNVEDSTPIDAELADSIADLFGLERPGEKDIQKQG